MTDIWDSKTRRQKHVNGTGAAADAHMEVVDDWMDMIDEGNKILKSGMNFFKANETELDPFEVGELLAEVDINNWSVPKLKQLIADAEAKGLGVPLPKKSEQEINKLAKTISPFIHKQITGKKKNEENPRTTLGKTWLENLGNTRRPKPMGRNTVVETGT